MKYEDTTKKNEIENNAQQQRSAAILSSCPIIVIPVAFENVESRYLT
jgi:hypothetical protein